MTTYKPIIGLELHVELATKSKMFCNCPADHFHKSPNSQTCPVCLGMPGTLPTPNRLAMELSIKISHALNCTINDEFIFARKHYFYPDLPKGYQITQFQNPVGSNGHLLINGKKFRINRVHIEEDTGKLVHKDGGSLVDFNRAGVPLVEIVTEPDFSDWKDVVDYFTRIQSIVRALGAADADMEKGQMRLEPNISLRLEGENDLPSYKVEVKNINSFRFVKNAIIFEIERQKKILENGETPVQETRGFDPEQGITFSQRSKETVAEYKYFPEPDIPPIVFGKEEIKKLLKDTPELPDEKYERYINELKISGTYAEILIKDISTSSYFDKVVSSLSKDKLILAPEVAKFIVNKKFPLDLPPEEFIERVEDLTKSTVLDEGYLSQIAEKVLSNNQGLVDKYKSGKIEVLNVLIGLTMEESKGQFSPDAAREKLKLLLSK